MLAFFLFVIKKRQLPSKTHKRNCDEFELG